MKLNCINAGTKFKYSHLLLYTKGRIKYLNARFKYIASWNADVLSTHLVHPTKKVHQLSGRRNNSQSETYSKLQSNTTNMEQGEWAWLTVQAWSTAGRSLAQKLGRVCPYRFDLFPF